MNTDTGELRRLSDLSEADLASGRWAPVSDTVAQAVQQADLAERVREIERLLEEAGRR